MSSGDKSTITGNVEVSNFFVNGGELTFSGTLQWSDTVKIQNSKVVFTEGAILRPSSPSNDKALYLVIGNGGYLYDNSSEDNDKTLWGYRIETGGAVVTECEDATEYDSDAVSENGTIIVADAATDRNVMAGGQILFTDDNGTLLDIKQDGWLIGQDNENGFSQLTFAAGTYDYKFLGIGFDNQKGLLGGQITVDGSTVSTELLKLNGGLLEVKSGSLSAKGLKSNGTSTISVTGGNFAVDTYESTSTGAVTLSSGTMNVTTLTLSDGSLTISEGAALATTTDQVFTIALGNDGSGESVGSTKYSGLTFKEGSTLTLNDEFYNLSYLKNARSIYANATLNFTGNIVDTNGGTLKEIDIDEVPANTILGTVDLVVNSSSIEESVGGASLVVDNNISEVSVASNANLTLVGNGSSLINFRNTDDGVQPSVSVAGKLNLGMKGQDSTGKLDVAVTFDENSELNVNGGSFELSNVISKGTGIVVDSEAALSIGKLTLGSAEKSTSVVGSVTSQLIDMAEDVKNHIINIGNTEQRGDLSILSQEKNTLSGLTFFLDPTWIDGQQADVSNASRLILNQTAIDSNIVVGQNSYVVLGGNSDDSFKSLFANGTLTWGKDNTTAAAYVDQPVEITGYLTVDGSRTELPDTTENAGSVKFASGSVLVANVTNLASDQAMITAEAFEIAKDSKAVIVGTLTNGSTYKLTSKDNADYWNTTDTLVSGNPLWDLRVNDDGAFVAKLTDARAVFGNLMQGHDIANAGMSSSNEYANALLTDELGLKPAAHLAARFDAAMNPAGAATVFTTAYDRAGEFRDAIRNEAQKSATNRLWAQITGGKTKLKGISTGAQSLHTDTDAYGLAIGGEATLSNGVLGLAFTAGTGDTKNDSVGLKDDFDFYGLSVYGKTTLGEVDVLADASMTFVKSDLTMGGTAAIDTDTTTAVYSVGAQIQKTFDVGVELTPFIGANLYHVRSDGYSNGHGAKVDDSDATAIEIPVGIKIAKTFDATDMVLRPTFDFAVVPTLGNRDIDSKVSFAGAQSTYNYTFMDDVKIRTNLGLTAQKESFSIRISAGYDWGNEEHSAAKLMLNAAYQF